MVSHAEIMSFLKRNADYNDMKGSTNGAGAYMGGYASDVYGNFPQAIGGCNMCGGAFIGGAYMGGCAMCMGGARNKKSKHCVEAKYGPSGKLRCADWQKGPAKKQMTLAQLYAKMSKPKKSVAQMMKAMAMADSKVPKKKVSFSLPPIIKAELASKGITKSHPLYRQCVQHYSKGPKKGRCSKFQIYGKPPMSAKQSENANRLGVISKLYSVYKMDNPNITRSQFFADVRDVTTADLQRKLKGNPAPDGRARLGYRFSKKAPPSDMGEDMVAYGFPSI